MKLFVSAGVAALLIGATCYGLEPCPAGSEGDGCAEVRLNRPSGFVGDNVSVSVNFTQGAEDGNTGEGSDDVAAVAFSIGIPGTGDGQPLQFSTAGCLDANGDNLPDAVTIPDQQIRDGFRVVIENAECVGGTCGCGPSRDSCLCPEDGQTRQNFVNVVVFGPKELPATGPVNIPELPDSAELLRLNLQIISGTPLGEIPLHIFAETDEGSVTKPQFAANLSIGDLAAIDQTADRPADLSKVRFVDGAVTVLRELESCAGDCDEDGTVVVAELITSVNIALDSMPVTACSPVDRNENNVVAIDELIEAVDKSLTDCEP